MGMKGRMTFLCGGKHGFPKGSMAFYAKPVSVSACVGSSKDLKKLKDVDSGEMIITVAGRAIAGPTARVVESMFKYM